MTQVIDAVTMVCSDEEEDLRFLQNEFLLSTLFQCATFALTSALLFRFEKIRYVYNRNGLFFLRLFQLLFGK